jgi:hypothetical protein
MKLDNISVVGDSWVDILMPDGSKTGIQFLLVGKDHPACKSILHKQIQRARKEKAATIEFEEKAKHELFASVIKSWRDLDGENPEKEVVYLNDEELQPTIENKVKVLSMFPFMGRQVDEYVSEDANFFKVKG